MVCHAHILSSDIGLVFGLVLFGLWAGFDWPLGWFCHTNLATLTVIDPICLMDHRGLDRGTGAACP